MIKYYKLFDLLNRRGMKKTELLEIMSSPTLAKLSKGEIVKTDIIDKICLFLKCQPGDIMECMEREDIGDGWIKETVHTIDGENYVSHFGNEEQYSPEYRLGLEHQKKASK